MEQPTLGASGEEQDHLAHAARPTNHFGLIVKICDLRSKEQTSRRLSWAYTCTLWCSPRDPIR
eukprot:1657532-Prymnesium_polylepis.1